MSVPETESGGVHGGPDRDVSPRFERLLRSADSIGARTSRGSRQRTGRLVAVTRAAAWLCAAVALPGSSAAAQGYLRAGVGIALDASASFTDVDCGSQMPAALYGCRTGGDGEPLRSAGEFAPSGVLEIGAGYAVRPAVRLQLRLTYRPAVLFEGEANFLEPTREQSVRVEGSTLSGLIEAEFDLPMGGALDVAGFRPFAGAGIGRVRHRTGETRMTFPATETCVPGASLTQWTWAVTAGMARAIGEDIALELAWRYTDQGDIETGSGGGRVDWRDGSRTLPLNLAPTRSSLAHHGVGLSVRYEW